MVHESWVSRDGAVTPHQLFTVSNFKLGFSESSCLFGLQYKSGYLPIERSEALTTYSLDTLISYIHVILVPALFKVPFLQSGRGLGIDIVIGWE